MRHTGLIALVTLQVLACDSGPAERAPALLVPVLRMLDEPTREPERPRRASERSVALADEWRPVVARSQDMPARISCPPADDRTPSEPCSLRIPPAARKHPAWLVSWKAQPGPQGADRQSPILIQAAELRDHRVPVPGGSRRGRVTPLPALEARDLVSDPVRIPMGARLRFGIGIESELQDLSDAVEFRVTVAGRTGEPLFRRVLDPKTTPGDRGWVDADLDLSGLAGEKVRLRFAARLVSGAASSLPVWADPTIVAPEEEPGPPSVILISLDTLRARSLSAYGYELQTMPFLEELAGRGALFESASTTYSYTLTSHMSLFSGLLPSSHGVYGSMHRLPAERSGIGESLRRADYRTAAITENGLLLSGAGFRRGFSSYNEDLRSRQGGGSSHDTFGRALAWAERHADERFLLFVHTYQVHSPYRPPEAYQELFGSADALEQPDRERRRYEQEARLLDDDLKSFLDGMLERVPSERLLIVITADHGEEFREHGLIHHEQIYDEVLQIPLVFVWDGAIPPGQRIATPASLIDVTPTILDLVGAPRLEGADGLSLEPLLIGGGAGIDRARVFAEGLTFKQFAYSKLVKNCYSAEDPIACAVESKGSLNEAGEGRLVAIRSQTHKCLRVGPDDVRCFDLVQDPREQTPLAHDAPEVEAMRSELAAFAVRVDSNGESAAEIEREQIPAEVRAKLEALGYVDDGR